MKAPIEGLKIKVQSSYKIEEVVTKLDGTAIDWNDGKKGEQLTIYVKRRNGEYRELPGKLLPKKDVNNYTIKSPEIHIEAYTRLDSKSQAESLGDEIRLPKIEVGEVLTADKLFGVLADFIDSNITVVETASLTKDFPKRKNEVINGERITSIEHHYRVFKTDKPKTVSVNLLGSKLNYPKNTIPSEQKVSGVAAQLRCEVAAVKAVIKTESGNYEGYFDNGLPKILFERHHFYALTDPNVGNRGRNRIPHPYSRFPDICNTTPGGYAVGVGEYVRLIKAARLDRDAAIKATSWGAFQVLAEYYEQYGYASPSELVNKCLESIDGHVDLFLAFLSMPEKRRAVEGLRAKDWELFTSYYNGGAWRQRTPAYPGKMAEAYAEFSK